MKTSNKLFVAAVALVLGSLATYDAALRAEYRTGHYKDPLRNYTRQASTAFDAVEVPAGTYFRVEIEAGPAGVWVNKEAAEYVRLRQHGRTLAVTLPSPEAVRFLRGQPHVIIHCPRLQQLTTDGPALAAKRKDYRNDPGSEVLVRNFNQDSLRVNQRRASTVTLESNNLRRLSAMAGAPAGSTAILVVEGTNNIQAANLDIRHQSGLYLKTRIPQLRHQFSDSATVSFSGTAAQGLGMK